MDSEKKYEALHLLMKTTRFDYPMEWAADHSVIGNFDGHEFAIDVFEILPQAQLEFLKAIRAVRPKLVELVGSRCIFLFHSPQATKAHYAEGLSGSSGAEQFLFEQVPKHAALREVM
jgi:hypothetical protein